MTVLAATPSVLDQPGTVAFLVIFGMGVILFFVFRSMSKHLRKIAMAARAEEEAAARAAAKDGEADGAVPVIADEPAPASPASGRRPAK
jgi:Na+-transporting methylmalonyl-CoA/oxaloacetate decarboxylase gamma subunit